MGCDTDDKQILLKMSAKKKGFTAAGFGIIVGIILLLLSGGLLLAIIKNQASKVDEKLQVDLCRISNEINFGIIKEKTSGIISGPQICSTIDKTEGKMQVPAKKYPQNNKGAEAEIRDMIKNCWHMWLDGSQKNTFEKYPFSEGCFTCYTFKVSKDASGVTFKSLSDSMSEPYFAKDSSNHCAGGGFSGAGGGSGGAGAGASFGIGTPASPSGVETAIREQCMTSCRGNFPFKVP